MDEVDIDDYSRDRSRSPVRDRTRSRSRSPVSRRDYGDNYGDNYGDYEESRGSRFGGGGGRRGRGRGGRFGGRGRDYGSRKPYSSYASGDAAEEYRNKTERNYDNSIFVGNIPFDARSSDIENMFRDDFNVIRADIVTNRGKSRGMATVEFSNKDDVYNAIQKFDHYDYSGREIFVRQDYPPPEDKKKDFRQSSRGGFRESGRGGRDSGRGGRDMGRGGRDRYGGRDGAPRDGPPSRFQGRQNQSQSQPPKPGTEVFIGNLPFSVNWQSLKDLMREVGEVTRADIRTDRFKRSKGFGTVVFETPEEAEKAVEYFQGYEIEGRKLDTRPGRVFEPAPEPESFSRNGANEAISSKNTEFTQGVSGDGPASDTIFVGNLPFVTSVDDLFDLFETIGKVIRAEIQYNGKGKPSGNAVVQFEVDDLADLAIKNLNEYNYGGRNLSVSYANGHKVEEKGSMEEDREMREDSMEQEGDVEGIEGTEEPQQETQEPQEEAMEEAQEESQEPEAMEESQQPEEPQEAQEEAKEVPESMQEDQTDN